MPSPVILTQGPLQVGQRTANIHPEHWRKEVAKYRPLDQAFPILTMLNKVRAGQNTTSRTTHYFEKPYNALTGAVDDVYNDTGFASAFAGSGVAGTVVVVKPATTDVNRVLNLRADMQVEFHSTSVKDVVKARIAAVETSGNVSFTAVLLEADTNNVLAGTGISWGVMQGTNGELFELGDAINEHETEFYNYVYTDDEPFAITRDELREESRLEEDVKLEREVDALMRINQRREYTVLEGFREKRGTKYSAGGLRFFLKAHEPDNVINWLTDTKFSAATDTVYGGTLDFLKRVFRHTRNFQRPGDTAALICSGFTRSLINDCVLRNGSYQIGPNTTKYGLRCNTIMGIDADMDIVEDPNFNHWPSKERTAYLVRPERMRRHEPKQMGTELARSKGLQRVPWSSFGKMDGDNFKSSIKGGWIAEETYSFDHLVSFAIIDNLGHEKS